MAEADSTSSPQEDTLPTPAPTTEPAAPPDAVVEPEETPSEVKESPRVEEATPAPTEPEAVQGETAHSAPNEPFQSEPEPFKPADAPSGSAVESTPKAAPTPMSQSIRDLRESARLKKQELKRKKLAEIMAELEEGGRITNDEVEKLLHVSDATATRYLSELEKEGKIKQVGKTGRGVVYERNSF